MLNILQKGTSSPGHVGFVQDSLKNTGGPQCSQACDMAMIRGIVGW